MTDFNLIPLLPELYLALAGMGLLMVGVSQGNESTRVISWSCVFSFFIAAILVLGLSWERETALNNMYVFDTFAGFMKLAILLGLVASVALSVRYLYQEQIVRFEYPVLIVFAGLGMMLMVSANSLLTMYMALELQSLSLYVLAAFRRNSGRSAEAGTKYFILGSVSSGMILFGISLIYGFVGSVDFDVIARTLEGLEAMPVGLLTGLVFLLAGLAFKISAAPFHMWTPDVYQGAPTAVTALFAMVPKIAAVGLLMRLLFEPFGAAAGEWVQIVYLLAVASMAVGAFAAIAQKNIKRLMAYSSIGHMGYALIGVAAGTPEGAGAVILYMVIYLIMTAGAFAVILSMRRDGLAVERIEDLSGLSQNQPWLAYSMAILMFSMSGIPPLAGFFGKLAVFQAAVEAQMYILAVIGVVTSVIAAYYYLKIVKVMFFDEAAGVFDRQIPLARWVVLFVSIAFVGGFVFGPLALFESTQSAAAVLFQG